MGNYDFSRSESWFVNISHWEVQEHDSTEHDSTVMPSHSHFSRSESWFVNISHWEVQEHDSTVMSGHSSVSLMPSVPSGQEMNIDMIAYKSSDVAQFSLQSSNHWELNYVNYLHPDIVLSTRTNLFIMDAIRFDTDLSMSLLESEGSFNHFISVRSGADGVVNGSNHKGVEELYSFSESNWKFMEHPNVLGDISFRHALRYPHEITMKLNLPIPLPDDYSNYFAPHDDGDDADEVKLDIAVDVSISELKWNVEGDMQYADSWKWIISIGLNWRGGHLFCDW
jgi:hypothetical protein